jgi:hypothetical protein
MYTYIAIFLGYISTYIPWSIIFLFIKSYGIKIYTITDRAECTSIRNRIGDNFTHITNNGRGFGYSIGKWYIIHIAAPDDNDNYLRMIATDSTYAYLTKHKEEEPKFVFNETPVVKDDKEIIVYERTGTYSHGWYKQRSITIPPLIISKEQDHIISDIRKIYASKGWVVAMIYGPPGSGKSVTSILLANTFKKGAYCNTFKPWEPGDTLSVIYSEGSFTSQSPLIIAFDEFDEAIQAIDNGILLHKNIPIQTRNKAGWNQLLDEIQIGMYPHLILMLTTNKTPDYINSLDTSYIRKKRVDSIYHLSEVYN